MTECERPTVLVLEDNEVNRRLVRVLLDLSGCNVLEAASVPEALALLEGPPPDLCLVDIRVPGGGGEAFLAELRKRPELDSVPAVAVTAQAMRGDREHLLAAGFDGYLAKPLDTRQFGPAIEGFLVARKAAGKGERP